MKTVNAAKTFPGLFYWSRLPGFAAFCGMTAGICAAKYGLDRLVNLPSKISIYITLLYCATFFSAAAGIFQKRQIMRAMLFAVSGASLFAASELNTRVFYKNMDDIGEYNQILTVRARISSPAARAYSGYRFRAEVIGADDGAAAKAMRGRTLQCVSREPVPPYGEVTIQGRYSAPRPAAGAFGFDQRAHFAANNVHGTLNVSRVLSAKHLPSAGRLPLKILLSPEHVSYKLRTSVHGVINKAPSENARGIFYAAFLGEKEHLPSELNLLFRRSGIIHLLAISGFHAALLYGAIFAALGVLAIPSREKTFISIAALWGYVFFIGFIPSLFRAAMMVTIFCLSMTLQRKNHAVHSLGIAGACWLFISPHSLFAPGFQLSFAATAGIIAMNPVFRDLTKAVVNCINNKKTGFIAGRVLPSFWVSVSGFAATAPPLLYHFGTLSLYGIFFNLIAIPLMSAAMWVFFAAILLSPLGSSPLGFLYDAAVWCSGKTLDVMVTLAGFSGHVSVSEVVVARTTALQLAVMVIFMVGLCTVRSTLRAAFAARAGAIAALMIAVSALYLSMTVKTEKLEFVRNASAASVIIHKDNTAWITAQGAVFDIRQLREREIEPLLYRKKIKEVTLFVINEEAEEEAHEFIFSTDYDPRVISIRKYKGGKDNGADAYTAMDIRRFVNADGSCSLDIGADGEISAAIRR